jgi:small lipoprotein (TIGR04452 family)
MKCKYFLIASAMVFCLPACVYTDAYGVVPPGTVSGEFAIDKIGGAAALSAQLAQKLFVQKGKEQLGSNFFGFSQTEVQLASQNRSGAEFVTGALQLQKVRNYKEKGVYECIDIIKSNGTFYQYGVFLLQFNPSQGNNGYVSATIESIVGPQMAVDECDVQASGRLVELGPISL